MRRAGSLKVILLTSAVWLIIESASLYYFQFYYNPKMFTTSVISTYESTRRLEVGDVVSEADLSVVKISKSEAVDGTIADKAAIIGKRVIMPIAKGEQFLPDRLVDETKYFSDKSLAYTIPVSLREVNGNAIQPWDFVDIRIVYENFKRSEVVLAKIPVVDIRNGEGKGYVESGKASPAFATFIFSDYEIALVDDAAKRGTLYLTKYTNLSSIQSPVTYVPSWQ